MIKEIRIKNLSKTESAEIEHIVEEFKAKNNIRFNKQAYLQLIKLGAQSKQTDEELRQALTLQEINNRLKVIEPELRLLFFGIFGKKPETLKELNKMDISKIPLLESIKNSL